MNITYSDRAKNIRIRVLPGGEVSVTAPKGTPKFFLERFVAGQSEWIEKQHSKLSKQEVLETAEYVYLFGKKYSKAVEYSSDQPLGFGVSATSLHYNPINPTATLLSKEYTSHLQRFLKSTAETFVRIKTDTLAKKFGLQLEKITFREQKTRWGSCSSQGNLNFNWRLVHFSPKAIEYVIVHELAHLTHHNHSAKFWHLVGEYQPKYKEHQKEFKRFHVQIS